MIMLTGFFAWLQQLFGSGNNRLIRRIESHLETLRIRELTFENQRHEIEDQLSKKRQRQASLEDHLRTIVDQDRHQTSEAYQVGQDLDVLQEIIADLVARTKNRRALEDLLRRVVSAGEELIAFLPQQPDVACELESNLRELVQQVQADNAEALGRLLTFLENKLACLQIVQVRHETSSVGEDMPESLRRLVTEKERGQRAEIEAEEFRPDTEQTKSTLKQSALLRQGQTG